MDNVKEHKSMQINVTWRYTSNFSLSVSLFQLALFFFFFCMQLFVLDILRGTWFFYLPLINFIINFFFIKKQLIKYVRLQH